MYLVFDLSSSGWGGSNFICDLRRPVSLAGAAHNLLDGLHSLNTPPWPLTALAPHLFGLMHYSSYGFWAHYPHIYWLKRPHTLRSYVAATCRVSDFHLMPCSLRYSHLAQLTLKLTCFDQLVLSCYLSCSVLRYLCCIVL